MSLIRVDTCELGQLHYRYQQYYDGVLVEGAQYIIHTTNDNKAIKSNGQIVYLDRNFSKNITDTSWIINYINATYPTYFISSPFDLVFTKLYDSLDMSEDNLVLAIKVEITDTSSSFSERIIAYFNPNNQTIIRNNNTADYVNNCITLYNGSRYIQTRWSGGFNWEYQLIDETRGEIRTYLDCLPAEGSICRVLDDDDNLWSLESERGATSAHWATGVSWDYFKNTFGHKGMDNDNGKISIRASTIYYGQLDRRNESSYDHVEDGVDKLVFGAGDNINYRNFASLDVVGHEFTHGVSKYSVDFSNSSYESCALKESFSDIFGTMIEFSVEEDAGDYEMLEDVAINPALKRSLQSPKSFGDPNTYKGQFWYFGSDVDKAEHTNNGVQNYWFYLLAEGGNGYNDNGEYYSVQGIGKDKAAKIAYRNLTSYLISSSIYSSARAGSIWAAVDLYGECSFEVQQVINSWNAVGVYGLQYIDPLNYCGDIYNQPINPIRSFRPMIFAPNVCSTTVKNGSNVRFVSASYIELQGGFEVEPGASFEADVYECNMINN
ncbi:MAG: M4 family metallopeptidase [Bacteroidales bacterium]|nr:M4 family metallopeptidase [Bacteroidales bacterium]